MSQGDTAVQVKPHYPQTKTQIPEQSTHTLGSLERAQQDCPARTPSTPPPKHSPCGSHGVLCPPSPDSAASPHTRATAHAVLLPKILLPLCKLLTLLLEGLASFPAGSRPVPLPCSCPPSGSRGDTATRLETLPPSHHAPEQAAANSAGLSSTFHAQMACYT